MVRKAGKVLGKGFSTTAAGMYMLVFAISIAVATFIENDFGTSSAQKLVYKARWFEALLLLFAITLIVNIFKYRMVPLKKWAQLVFHLAMVIILAGAAITRYTGWEGIIHIREGSASNIVYSDETYLNFEAIYKGQHYEFHEPVLFASLGPNRFHQRYLIADRAVDVRLKEVIPNPETVLVPDPEGTPVLKIVFGSSAGREEYFLSPGDRKRLHGLLFNFDSPQVPEAFNIIYRNDSLFLKSGRPLLQTVMATRLQDTLAAWREYPLKLSTMYNNGEQQFVFGDFEPAARVEVHSAKRKIENSSTVGLLLEVTLGADRFEKYLFGQKGMPGEPVVFENNDMALQVSYGAREIELPFSLYLRDFILERYPGTNSPASYASEVTLSDPEAGIQEDFRIYMNHILNYRGYRFFQSSYDNDELGTWLSVNHDAPGTLVTYLGYALLTLGMLLVFFSPNTRFRKLSQNLRRIRSAHVLAPVALAAFLLSAPSAKAQKEITPSLRVVSSGHARDFSTVAVQDFRGRMKPMHTLTRELMRKVYGKESYNGYTADQVILSMYANPEGWFQVPFIRLGKHPDIARMIGREGQKRAAYIDFFDENGQYLLADAVAEADHMAPAERGTREKQLIKVDERVNIMNMIFSGNFFRVIPVPGDPNHTWVSETTSAHGQAQDSVAAVFFSAYRQALHQAVHSGDYTEADQLIDELKAYQRTAGADVMPSHSRLKAEIWLNKAKIFNRLAPYYFLLGLLFLGLLFYTVFRPGKQADRAHRVLLALVVLGFLFHTLGLGLRWYVSGRAPWSNGYESMIYIAWTATLAGLVFTRKSPGGMAATQVLSGTVLMIAMLSYLDPEITPLVPVLKSYWLTIHVGMEAGSYGFLMLGAVIGLINLMLYGVLNPRNSQRVLRMIKEMSYISEMTLTGGLIMLSIGTYLGGVWANESWGRYWGWDAKETWALVSILVYAFILHMRLIPGLRGLFAYNLATLFGLVSVIMTYYGVNYYLSGLHSYATGDPVPIPLWVYISVAFVTATALWAYYKKRKYGVG